MSYSAAFVAAVEACGRLDPTPIRQRPGEVAEFSVGGWHVAINASDAEAELGPQDGMRCAIPPKHVGAWWNGFLAGIFSAHGGTIAAGALANEDTFIEAMNGLALRGEK